MNIRDAFDEIDLYIEEYKTSGLIAESNVTFDFRVSAGYVRGALTFTDGSQLHFREFLSDSVDAIEKLDYSYHYQTVDAVLIFRRPKILKHSNDFNSLNLRRILI